MINLYETIILDNYSHSVFLTKFDFWDEAERFYLRCKFPRLPDGSHPEGVIK